MSDPDDMSEDAPEECPECGAAAFRLAEDTMNYHGCRFSMGFMWRCTECRWVRRALTQDEPNRNEHQGEHHEHERVRPADRP